MSVIPRVLYRVQLGSQHLPTGFTRHIIHGEPMEMPTELRIAQFPGAHEVYLFYCDDTGLELSDTLHETVARAMEQAELEFCVRPDDWETVS
jgi:hypothetical protein